MNKLFTVLLSFALWSTEATNCRFFFGKMESEDYLKITEQNLTRVSLTGTFHEAFG